MQPYEGDRLTLLPLFRLADESEVHILSYYEIGHVLVARSEGSIVGLLQISEEQQEAEIVSLAVIPERQRQGIGTLLIDEATDYCRLNSNRRLTVCTGAWETDNVTFYMRRGFRIFNVARDFFTREKGYELANRDQVQLEKCCSEANIQSSDALVRTG
ncbi:hypothetical protein HYPDE_26478 [Hyphomicrobium denitrificans 1NES1]|uniref:N-acetyltransferase domain-containing protein n=1 Tax=Hyphomicrobium denitrificans 1NES1 TaxID=670307 RepID=N0B8X0_9HYPH|nr:GNAT family N-acetyltransferase [Hyphomicrobium denitrificans]AGK56976.1 hypothetical protein HYPDE_26478 [Hyphomicrobium denitrificans 1NES1]